MTTSLSRADLLSTAITAVAAACRVTRRIQQDAQPVQRHTKEDLSPVTVADYAAQAIIARQLVAALGPIALVAEEDAASLRLSTSAQLLAALTEAVQEAWPGANSADLLDAIDCGNHHATGECYWTLDPVDGTKGFLRGGQYAVSLALIEKGEVVLGVLGCPNLGDDYDRPFDQPDARGSVFYATRGGGSWAVRADNAQGSPQRLDASRTDDVTRMRICESVEAAHSRLDHTARIVEYLGVIGAPARLDSQCKYAVVARGQAEAYLRLPTRRDYIERIWDHAAGVLVAEEAGAIVSEVLGRRLDFTQGEGLGANRGIICAARGYYRPLRNAVSTLGLFAD